jgi:hypothetical protein
VNKAEAAADGTRDSPTNGLRVPNNDRHIHANGRRPGAGSGASDGNGGTSKPGVRRRLARGADSRGAHAGGAWRYRRARTEGDHVRCAEKLNVVGARCSLSVELVLQLGRTAVDIDGRCERLSSANISRNPVFCQY